MNHAPVSRSLAMAAYALVGTALSVALSLSASADDRPVAVKAELKFDTAPSVLVRSRLIGPATHEYTFEARKGQRVALMLTSDWAQLIGIDLLSAGVDTAVYTNFIDGSTAWHGVAPGNGTYTVRLAFLRSESRRSGLVDYALEVKLSDVSRIAARR